MAQEEKWFPAAPPEKGVIGRFAYHDILDIPASKEKDEKVFQKVIVCWMKAAGSTDVSVVKVKEHNQRELTRRFSDAWRYFQGEIVEVDGTPVSALGISNTKELELQLQGITTVEQLRDLSDAGCTNVGFGTRKLRELATDYLAKGKDALPAHKIANGGDPAPKRRGRPPKAQAQVAA